MYKKSSLANDNIKTSRTPAQQTQHGGLQTMTADKSVEFRVDNNNHWQTCQKKILNSRKLHTLNSAAKINYGLTKGHVR